MLTVRDGKPVCALLPWLWALRTGGVNKTVNKTGGGHVHGIGL